MRISDWSSDVCSSDLLLVTAMVGDGFTRLSRSARMPMMFPRGLADWRIGDSEQATPGHRPVQAASVADFQAPNPRSEEHTSELQSLMRSSYAVFCLQKKKNK